MAVFLLGSVARVPSVNSRFDSISSLEFFTDILWYAAQLSIFEVLFRHISQLNGWTLPTIRVFMGILFVTDSIFMFFFQVNLDQLGTKIRRGDLDLLLAKPVNSQWFLSLQKISMPYAGNFVMACMWVGLGTHSDSRLSDSSSPLAWNYDPLQCDHRLFFTIYGGGFVLIFDPG
jgi:ABC-type uncharacterized transport system permease subunit